MDDAARVGELDRPADIDEHAQQAVLRRALGDASSEGLAGDALHREERAVVLVDAELVDRHDRGMLEPGLDARLAQRCDRLAARIPVGRDGDHQVMRALVATLGERDDPAARVAQVIYKVKTGVKPHREDLAHLEAIRKEFGDKVDLRVDYNQALAPFGAIKILRDIEEFSPT